MQVVQPSCGWWAPTDRSPTYHQTPLLSVKIANESVQKRKHFKKCTYQQTDVLTDVRVVALLKQSQTLNQFSVQRQVF